MLSPEIASVTALATPTFWSCQLSEEKESSVTPGIMDLEEPQLLQIVDHEAILPPILSSDLRLLTPSTTLPPLAPGNSFWGLKKPQFLENEGGLIRKQKGNSGQLCKNEAMFLARVRL